ncbi:MAG TPA: hypothetical protein PKE19_12510, partial [Aestuariivirga sp.]|nr:hypothetical protein [Aestuariivirga sp.]
RQLPDGSFVITAIRVHSDAKSPAPCAICVQGSEEMGRNVCKSDEKQRTRFVFVPLIDTGI